MSQRGKFEEAGEASSVYLQDDMVDSRRDEGPSPLNEKTGSVTPVTMRMERPGGTTEEDKEVSFDGQQTPMRTTFRSPTPPRSRKKSLGRPRKALDITSTPVTDCVTEEVNCPVCKCDVSDDVKGLMCDVCRVWFHCSCLLIPDSEYHELSNSENQWCCVGCKSRECSQFTWGDLKGEKVILQVIKSTYLEITKWKNNLFTLPRGKSGIHFINELTRLIYLFTDETAWKGHSISMLHVFIPLMLQKPSANSKAKANAKFLADRLVKWSEGDLQGLMDEAREIQVRISQSSKKKEISCHTAFCRLMLLGQVGKALKIINNNSDIRGVHSLTRHVKTVLACKHPDGKPAPSELKLDINAPQPQRVIFEQIDAILLHKIAKSLHGSGGPTHIGPYAM